MQSMLCARILFGRFESAFCVMCGIFNAEEKKKTKKKQTPNETNRLSIPDSRLSHDRTAKSHHIQNEFVCVRQPSCDSVC